MSTTDSPAAVKLPHNKSIISEATAFDSRHGNHTSDLEVAWNDTHQTTLPRSSHETKPWSWRFILTIAMLCAALVIAMAVVVTRHHRQSQSAASSLESSLTVYQSKQRKRSATKTRAPTMAPTKAPVTRSPTTTAPATLSPISTAPTSVAPTGSPTTSAPLISPITNAVTTFYVIGDVPYNSKQAIGIRQEILNIPADADFVVHVGDLRKAGTSLVCQETDYTRAEALLNLSAVPVFLLLGDNDSTDCPNPEQGLQYWRSLFVNFESKYWASRFTITRLSGHPETFSFEWKGTLFVGLQLVGGEVRNATEWTTRLTDEVNWVKELITDYKASSGGTGKRVVLFGHADPNYRHADFFQPLVAFIENDLQNSVPIVYIHGDGHRWDYRQSWFNQSSLLRIMVTGGASEPPLKIVIDGDGSETDPAAVFAYDRELVGWNNATFNYTSR